MKTQLKIATKTVRKTQRTEVLTFTGKHAAVFYAICDLAEQRFGELQDDGCRDEKDARWWNIPHRDQISTFLRMVNAGRGLRGKMALGEKPAPPLS